VGFKFT